MIQQEPFEAAPVAQATIASPLCIYSPCTRKGRAVLGPPRDLGGCINRSITCLKCGCTGDQSTNMEPRKTSLYRRSVQTAAAVSREAER